MSTAPSAARIVLTITETAERLGLSTRTVRERIASGELLAYRVGKGPRAAIRLKISDVDALLEPVGAQDIEDVTD